MLVPVVVSTLGKISAPQRSVGFFVISSFSIFLQDKVNLFIPLLWFHQKWIVFQRRYILIFSQL